MTEIPAPGADPPSPDGAEWRIHGTAPDGRAVELRLRPDTARTVGRAPIADVVVDAPFLSRVHCLITARRDVLMVEDLGSANGTFVNGRRVERAALADGDRLAVGRVEFTVSRRPAGAR